MLTRSAARAAGIGRYQPILARQAQAAVDPGPLPYQ
jgi:hypothetical protein